ncbi:NUDIX domain-containing protein [Deinococcus radiodurans]|jgi:ADP-ribose pyrophosphatase|uniref:MutT/nudix family protein n=1 Tax=Deinococcus radiodurans (strain ATCC 13939 / DSM 20539 / JCM 16871 / CCUG 27074 / LMG 4051 / NBRC 15346 / NCIMB 9279 / VKM B-1422 / R1) TaxID=243230 RepID=Q9RY58_DEIRA|nr:NUDIX domain-containing protein [Deinococcus radiodurans]AAF09685.1 MutT/nudix family protein [Deinococcus radiodurans R1 = ATCC 13939 = DSM 20539]ANC72618.1 hypothetical protein A2G07_13045 [Deinococcus radiodurans R1 = ATCC 13939 = DSM 20539]QEM72068.1 NUDIX domain-containing protein [Deinococcus radiodurans]UDK99303.1 NUDIX domain-containing protein [Deinococcus radiodurans R1 = ATCC 13939 = DSM 20539]UID69103.1 MutT/nudix family protein [Deinococcus radiodurans R1 = ATCC 13939 = DSM 205
MKRTGAGIAVRRGAAVLLVRRRDDGQWDVPGGGSEGAEAIEETTPRELREETELTVGEMRILGMWPPSALPGDVSETTAQYFAALHSQEPG